MPGSPQFQYFLTDRRYPVQPGDALWNSPLPLKPNALIAADQNKADGSITYGDYFSAVRFFLMPNGLASLCVTAAGLLGRRIIEDQIETIDVFLVKHGQFYHPSRIIVHFSNTPLSFVVNAAVSQSGVAVIDREYACLKDLDTDFPYRFVPAVYCVGAGRTAANRTVKMFLGEWLEGYSEFHLSRKKSTQGIGMAVWAEPGHRFFLSTDQSFHLYRMAAMILTAYFNPETYQHIFPWHHAAGDFVVKVTERQIDVKLISVRRYEPIFEESGMTEIERTNIQALPNVLLLFFLNLAIRMRLDRLDGIGEMVWSDPIALEAVRDGFFQGLDLLIRVFGLPDNASDYIRQFFASQTVSDLYDLSQGILSRYSPGAAGADLVRPHLKAHVADLKAIFNPA